MRLVNMNFVEEGSVLARPIIDAFGRILLQAGIRLRASYIERLKDLGYDMLFIEDDRLDDVEALLTISAQTREVAYKTILNVCKHIEDDNLGTLPVDKVRFAVQEMLNDILSSMDVLANLADIQGYDNYTFQHSINTTIIALVLAIASNFSEQKLLEFGMGVLMHDIGKIKIPDRILNKVTPLTPEEFEEIKKHPTDGFEILRLNKDFNLLSAHVALQHQEKWDGSGYPRGLKGREIHEYGRIASVADVYEALTSRRVYRSPIEPNEAFEYIISQQNTHFDPKILEVFRKHIAAYPSGVGVILSNGQRGNVVRQNPSYPNRPHVRVFYDQEEELSTPLEYNLAEMPSLMIVAIENR